MASSDLIHLLLAILQGEGPDSGLDDIRELPAAAVSAGNGLQSMWAAIANRNNAHCDIPVLGDSVTMGYGVTNFTDGFVQQLNRAFRAKFPTTANAASGGLGFIPISAPTSGSSTYTWPFTPQYGGATKAVVGPVRSANALSSSQSYTWTAPAGTTSVQVVYFDASASGAFSYQVNSGSTTTVNNTETGAELLTASISMTSGDVLTITYVSGFIVLDGILHFAGDENSGVTFHACGHAGWTAANSPTGWNQNAGGYGNWAQCFANAFTNPVAIAIQLGFNDAGVYDAADFTTYLEDLVATVRTSSDALTNIPVVFLALYAPDVDIVDPDGWEAYVTGIKTAASNVGNALVVDLSYKIDPFGASGAIQYDVEHPNAAGAALVGELVSTELSL